MTARERAKLEERFGASRRVNWKEHLLLLAASLTVFPAFIAFLAMVPMALLAGLLGYTIRNGAWRNDPVTYYGTIFIFTVIWGGCVVGQVRWSIRQESRRRQRQSALETDLARGVVRDEQFDIVGVKLLREPEHGMIFFFLRLSNGKCFVLFDYGSVETADEYEGEAPPTLRPGERLHLLTLPVSKQKIWSFSGESLALPAISPMQREPDGWPDDESWCRVKWENIERHYGRRGT